MLLQVERFPGASDEEPSRLGKDLPAEEHKAKLTERIKAYAQRVYKRVTSKPESDTRIAGICQRENSFYIDTVLSFRDRRYEYKGLVKQWKGKLGAAADEVCACCCCCCCCLWWWWCSGCHVSFNCRGRMESSAALTKVALYLLSRVSKLRTRAL
jgi:hypothetical protein